MDFLKIWKYSYCCEGSATKLVNVSGPPLPQVWEPQFVFFAPLLQDDSAQVLGTACGPRLVSVSVTSGLATGLRVAHVTSVAVPSHVAAALFVFPLPLASLSQPGGQS